ncbi:MAG: M20/M25/M40 family metallo-hydrolase [Sutterellaceae bacterium]|nr:M20/M25/M40 family metallo-hydrolase [Sutterellaceae bacterium]MDY2867129.1 M20/M25/M40 family metallo-hydrolase [Mesosutterella sp.]
MPITPISELPEIPQGTASAMESLAADHRVKALLDAIREDDEATLEEQIAICEVAAPPFKEKARGEMLLGLFRKYGLSDVRMDEVGNVLGVLKGSSDGPVVQIAAHQDTVFPEGTDVRVKREGDVYRAPGISDDTRGLASMLCVARQIVRSGLKPVGSILFTASVGEEGNGDLRGEKYLHYEKKIPVDGFIGIDAADVRRILSGATGAHRWLISYDGPGGHSYHKFGIAPSAIHAMGRAIAKFADLRTPEEPRTTFNLGVIKGGSTVNAIAEHCEAQLDLRSGDNSVLLALEKEVLAKFDEALEEENRRVNAEGDMLLRLTKKPIGNRPAGVSDDLSPVILAARAAQKALGIPLTRYMSASTDHNVPLSRGIPSTTLGAGGVEGNNHALNEWWKRESAWLSPQLVALTALSLTGVEGITAPLLGKGR